ncbi:Vms1/Ankzf1 family peptidyl-tRNA hydrolase [Actinotalea sp.]|uniref:baeRF2 domain-containing protein n=1 Tax=Actinotalea sp. TaxID=1872145 RepID=UPI00356163C2
MKLDALKPLLDHDGPLTTVSMDVTRGDEVGDRDLRNRWQGVRRSLEGQGAPAPVLDALADLLLRPTHVPGPHGRLVVVDGLTGREIVLDRVLATAPVRDEAVHGAVPPLVPAARAVDEAVRYLLVEVDRSGADLTWSGVELPDEELSETVEGGHDLVHKVRTGDWWHSRRTAARIEDSWERNAQVVADELDRVVLAHRPELVMLTGDVRAVAMIREAVGHAVAEVLVEVPGGSRADGIKEDVFAARLHEVVEAYRDRRRQSVLDRVAEGLGRGDGAVTDLGDVVEVLRRGQVAELVLGADAATGLAERTVWVGPGPLELAMRRSELAGLGVDDGHAQEMRADVAVLRAAIAQDAGATFDLRATVPLMGGIGAVLRWSDPATPHETAPASTRDRSRRAGRSMG